MYEYRLIRSDRRTLSVEVAPDGAVTIRAPRRISQREIDRFARSHEAWVLEHQQRQAERRAAHPEPTPEEAGRLRELAKEILPDKVAYYSRLMGLSPTNVRVTSARTRWGSCSPKNVLCFSWRLMAYPEEAIDYVVVHELAHMRRRDHSPAFYAIVASILPDYQRRRALLRR